MTREKYPEKIPFRLTRMLINAMEITGIDGTYRCTCESVMKVLRHNKDSLMAVLEAFVYDPLLNWRLIDNANATKSTKRGKAVVPHQSMAATATTVHPSSGSLQDRDGSDTLEITSSDGHPTGTTPAAVSKKVNPEAGMRILRLLLVCVFSRIKNSTAIYISDNTEKPQPEALNKKALDVVSFEKMCLCY